MNAETTKHRRPKTVGEWYETGHKHMEWSIIDDSHVNELGERLRKGEEVAEEELRRAYDSQRILSDAGGAPDGEHHLEVSGFLGGDDMVSEGTVVVMDGKIDPLEVAEATYTTILQMLYGDDAFDHRFIESLKWDGRNIKVNLGS